MNSLWHRVLLTTSSMVTWENVLVEEITIVVAMIPVFERSGGKFLQRQQS